MNTKSAIDQALEIISSLDSYYNSDNVILIGQLCNKLSVISVTIGKEYTKAHKWATELEDNYEFEISKYVKNGDSVSKAEREAKVEFFDKKKEVTGAKNVVKSLDVFLRRVDRMLDHYKQYISSIKTTDLKHI